MEVICTHVNGTYNQIPLKSEIITRNYLEIYAHVDCELSIADFTAEFIEAFESMDRITLFIYPQNLYYAGGFIYPNNDKCIYISQQTLKTPKFCVEAMIHEYQHILQLRERFLVSKEVLARPDQALAWMIDMRPTYRSIYVSEKRTPIERIKGYAIEIDATCAAAHKSKKPFDKRAVFVLALALNTIVTGVLGGVATKVVDNMIEAHKTEQVK